MTRIQPLTRHIASLFVLAALFACGGDSSETASIPDTGSGADVGVDTQPEETCTEGALGCTCFDGIACLPGSDWVCIDGLCREPACEEGTEGCACFSNGTCLDDGEGEALLCEDGICAAPPGCTPGTDGCDCTASGTCEVGLVCAAFEGRALCAAEGCDEGTEGCPCAEGRACEGALACYKETCTATSCRPGALDCFCDQDLSCDEGLQCDGETERCEEIPCTPGSNGCTCDAGDCADPDAVCNDDGLCEPVDCPVGSEGCACLDGERCHLGTGGDQLTCEGMLCRAPDCAPGEPGCACARGIDCDAGHACVEGLCQPEGCVQGSLYCACAGGLCQSGMRCRADGVCVDGTGFVNNPCREDGSCERGSRCSGDNVCARCTLGSIGCSCDDGDRCLVGAACFAGTCIAERDVPPTNNTGRCYSYCDGVEGLEVDGEFIECGANNLLEACVDGRVCVEGSCVREGEGPRTCTSELNCPFWQTCVLGQCASECSTDAECAEGKQCHSNVCRVSCDSRGESCPRSYQCETTDGESGFCMPIHPSAGERRQQRVVGGFGVSESVLEFTNTQVTRRFALLNNSPVFETFIIRKRSHNLQFADGSNERARRAADGRIRCEPGDEGCQCDADDPTECACEGPGCACTQDSDCAVGGYQCQLGACRPPTCTDGACPMFWLQVGVGQDEPSVGEEIEVGVASGGRAEITLTGAADMGGVRWQGSLEVVSGSLGTQSIDLLYNEVPEGQWRGEMVYLANFDTRGLDVWRQSQATRNRDDNDPPLGNAMLRRWVALRNGRISYDEMLAVLVAVQNGSWEYANVMEACEADLGACYLYDISADGVETLSTNLDAFPVPSGAVELPFGVNLRIPDPEFAPHVMEGRIESSYALHYAGSPSVRLRFVSSPESCDLEAHGACVAFLEGFEADVFVGGRYTTDPQDRDCALRGPSYVHTREPWLVPGFVQDTTLDPESGRRYRYACRDGLLPFTGDEPQEQDALTPLNVSLALSNPIPDAMSRRRHIRLVDGALFNQSQLIIFFEETFDSFLSDDGEPFSAYGFMILQRHASDIDTTDDNGNDIADVYEGATPLDERPAPEADLLAPACSDAVLERVLGPGDPALTPGNLAQFVSTLITGAPLSADTEEITPGSMEQVHYLCEDTGLFDGGSNNTTPHGTTSAVRNDNSCGAPYALNGTCDDGTVDPSRSACRVGTDVSDCGTRYDSDRDASVACPPGSRVEFFTVDSDQLTQADIANLPCQEDGSCLQTLALWKSNPEPLIQIAPAFRCTDPDEVFCDANRKNLRQGKTFFAEGESNATFVQLQSLIDEAFRYKTRFQNREGQGLSFAPTICEPDSDAVPYCYDPEQIAEVQARIDCLLHIHANHYGELSGTSDLVAARRMLDDLLVLSFSQQEERRPSLSQPIVHDGFERQLAQLLIMQGDDAFTKAFTSRFDLAQINAASFDGSLFEPGGIDLSGAVGFEMHSLYQAAQYYQMVLDRFFTMSPAIWGATRFGVNDRNFVTPDTVLRYFDRVIRASTQKARAWSEVSKRYQNLGRPDLARSVVERAYTATYLESVVMSQIMRGILEGATLAENRPQIERAVEDAQLTYRVALTDMQDVHSAIEDNVTIFGFTPDYVPFPALDAADFRQSNAFETLLLRARNKVQFAREKEDGAINSSREFESSQTQFQSELTQVKNNFENQLAELCGTFIAGDEDDDPDNDRVLPAITKYAHLDPVTTLLGDPCGLIGTGQIHQALAALEDLSIDARALQIQQENVLEEVDIERERVSGQCGEILEAADFLYGKCEDDDGADFITDPFQPVERGGCVQSRINDLQRDIRISEFGIRKLQAVQGYLGTALQLTNPPTAITINGYITGSVLTEAGIAFTEGTILERESQIAELERMRMKWQTENECDQAKIESTARVRSTLLRLRELELETLRLDHRAQLAVSEIQRLRNQARRLQAQQAEAEQLAINVQAAHNNPNVRIYKNDAIINAEIAFEDAIREVYKLTKVFEYYTSQSYANKNDLFLIRMISRGDKNLENYLNELESTFFDFEEFFGAPSSRVHIVSLKDDILAVPFTDEAGEPLNTIERTRIMRERLIDPGNLDRNGYITLPFSTDLRSVSPLTRNHKILHVEADIYGSESGDLVGRVYMRQKGTSVIHGVNGDRQFHRFDERTAVINAIFGGVRFFDNTIYQSHRLRDRPFVNTQWELVINQRDEQVNQDINLNALTDIRLYVYYTDFTVY